MEYYSVIAHFNNDLWGHHFVVPHEVGDDFVQGNDRRVICTINGKFTFPCALMPYGENGYFININKEIRDKLFLQIGSRIKFTLQKDESRYGMPMPEEMEVYLEMDPEASGYFHALTPGKQRTLIYLVSKPKTSTTRLNKAAAILEYLKTSEGKLDFKALNQFMKDYNKL